MATLIMAGLVGLGMLQKNLHKLSSSGLFDPFFSKMEIQRVLFAPPDLSEFSSIILAFVDLREDPIILTRGVKYFLVKKLNVNLQ